VRLPGEPAMFAHGDLPFFAHTIYCESCRGPSSNSASQASPDAHLCCGSTLHTMTGARLSSSLSSLSSLLPTAAAAAAAASFYLRDLLVLIFELNISFGAT
jgi:hypothetical protein